MSQICRDLDRTSSGVSRCPFLGDRTAVSREGGRRRESPSSDSGGELPTTARHRRTKNKRPTRDQSAVSECFLYLTRFGEAGKGTGGESASRLGGGGRTFSDRHWHRGQGPVEATVHTSIRPRSARAQDRGKRIPGRSNGPRDGGCERVDAAEPPGEEKGSAGARLRAGALPDRSFI